MEFVKLSDSLKDMLNKEGKKVEGKFEKEYGKKKGKEVFYATKAKSKALKKMCK